MKGDFTRLTGKRATAKHYNGVFRQQGRVQLDSDWNEHVAIVAHQRKVRTIDTIGQCGAPLHHGGFQILHPGNDALADVLLSTGRFYAGGLLCETTPSSYLPIRDLNAEGDIFVDDIKLDGIPFTEGQWIQILTEQNKEGVICQLTAVEVGVLSTDRDLSALVGDRRPYLRRLILFSEQTDLPNQAAYEATPGQKDLFYLDVWERHITTIEDPYLREVALGGPDTDTRSRIVAQVKVLEDVGDVECGDFIDQWEDLIKLPNGRLSTRLVEPDDPIGPCQMSESGGYLGLDNRLYRVEIHEVGDEVTFKWSSDNGAIVYPIEEFRFEGLSVTKIKLKQNGKDNILRIKPQDWIEVSGEVTDLNTEQAGTIAQVVNVEGDLLTLDRDVAIHKDEPLPKVRRWDVSNQRPEVVTPISDGPDFQLKDGIEISFSGTEFKVGDYWVFSARSLTSEIEFLDNEKPYGIQHHYCKLGLVTGLDDGGVEIEDCRPSFPPLTELPEGEAGKCCTYHVRPELGWQQVFDQIKDNEDAMICFEAGEYRLEESKIIAGKGHLKLIGSGLGTRIIAMESESALVFDSCKSLIFRDMHIESQKVGFGQGSPNRHLQGALTIMDCPLVDINCLSFRCGHYSRNAATCLTVRSSFTDCTLRVENSTFRSGYLQQGILLVNVKNATVENNEFLNIPNQGGQFRQRFYRDKLLRAEVRNWMIPSIAFGKEEIKTVMRQRGVASRITLQNGTDFAYIPHSSIKAAWANLFEAHLDADVKTKEELVTFITTLTNKLFFENDFLEKHKAFTGAVHAIFEQNFSSKAITIGGEQAINIQVNNNSIEGFLEGIHVGLSNNKNPDLKPLNLTSNNVNIQNNRIAVVLPPFIKSFERYGVFVGNCLNLNIENNSVYLERFKDMRKSGNDVHVEGIRVWGVFGKRMLINQNVVCGKLENPENFFDIAIRVFAENERKEVRQWVVSNNVCTAKKDLIINTSNSIQKLNNYT